MRASSNYRLFVLYFPTMPRPEDQPKDQGQDQPGENLPAVRDSLDIATASRGTLVRPGYYLSRFGFTDRFPVLLADLNRKLSSLGSDPAVIGMTLHPNLDTPQLSWEPAFVPAPEVRIEFPPYRSSEGRLLIGKPIINPGTFYETAGDDRYSSYDLETSTTLKADKERASVGFHEKADNIVAVDWRQLKKFVKAVYPKKQAVLLSRFEDPHSAEELKRLEEVGHVSTYSPEPRTIVEHLGSLDDEVFQGLPGVGYSVVTVDRDFIEKLKSNVPNRKDLKRYIGIKEVPDELLYDWHSQTYYPKPTPPLNPFLFLTIKESSGQRYFEIRGLEYEGGAKSIERILGLFAALFDLDPSGHSQFQADTVRRRYK